MKARFAAGCFWHIQEEFDKLDGIIKSEVGYSGGEFENPSYEDVSSGKTKHVESVEIEFNEKKISYQDLLNKFFVIHDPTTLNRQGPDFGSQYRSVIFYFNVKQKKQAEEMIKRLNKTGLKIVTELQKAGKFWKAEKYHQKYNFKRKSSCSI